MSYPVPLITSITPWMWLDADDATTITTSGSTLTGWKNKGSTGTTSFGSLSGDGTGTYNTVTANGRPLISFNNRIFTTNSITLTSQSFAIFAVYSVKSSYSASTQSLLIPNTADSMGGPNVFESAVSGGVPFSMCINQPTFGPRLVGTSTDANGIGLKMGTWILNTDSANSLVANNGMLTTLATNNAASGANTTTAYAYNLNGTTSAITDYGEVLVYMGPLTTAQRQSIEGYLAWKWGLQFSLPPQHPNHPYYNKASLLKLPVPLNNDILPWVWYDADDPTTVAANNTTLTGWQNKGTTGSTAGGTVSGTITTGATTLNGRNVITIGASSSFTTPSLTPTSQSWSAFFVNKSYADIGLAQYPHIFRNTDSGLPWIFFGNDNTYGYSIGGRDTGSNRVIASVSNRQNQTGLYSVINSTSTANNVIAINGTNQTLSINIAAGGTTLAATTYFMDLNSDIAELLIYMGEITTTQRYHIEGYLAWKWGLQTSLPTTHPYHPTFKDSTMGLYLRPRLFVSTYAGLSGTSGTTDDVARLSARFSNPEGICVDSSGNLYVSELNNRIRRIPPTGNVTTLAGTATLSGTTDATGVNARFNQPHGLALNPDNSLLYVADFSNHRIRQIVIATGVVTTLAGPTDTPVTGSADGTGTEARFNNPIRLAVHPTTGDIYVSDSGNQKIRKITPAGVVTTPYGPPAGTTTSGATDGVGNAARFFGPFGLVFDSTGENLYVSDQNNKKIRKINLSTNEVTTYTGLPNTASTNSTHSNGFGPDIGFVNLRGICRDAQNILYTIDGSGGNNIRKISPGGGVVTIAGPAPTATTAGTANGMDGVAQYNYPTDIVSYNNDFYVVDRANHSIRLMTAGSTNQVGTYSTALNNNTLGVACDGFGNVYTATESHAVYRINIYNAPSFFAGSTAAASGTTDAAGTSARFNIPIGIGFDPWYNLYVADYSNHRVRKISPAGLVTTVAGTGTASGVDGPGSSATFNQPRGIGCDRFGNIYVAQFGGASIRKITPKGFVSRIAGTGVSGFDNASGNALISRVNNPSQIAVDSEGNIFIIERGNHRLRRITPAGVISTFAGSGANAVTDGTGSSAAFRSPEGVCVDANDSLYVCDLFGATLRQVTTGTVVTTIAGLANTAGSEDGVGSVARFNSPGPQCVTIDSAGNLFLTDYLTKVVRCVRVYNPGRPVVTGLPSTGITLTADTSAITDRNTGIAFTYQWLYSDSLINPYSNITSATNSSYIANLNEANAPVRAYASYTNTVGSTVNVRSDPVGPIALVIPGTPTPATIRPFTNDGFIRFNWTIPDQTFSSSITVVCSGPNAGTRVIPANAGETIFTGLTNGSNYDTDIFVTSAGGVSSVATSYRATIPGTTPSVPLTPNFSVINTNQLRVTWSTPASDGGSPIGWYVVLSSDNVYRYGIEPFRREFVSPPLPSGTYIFNLRAINSAGYGASASAQVVIPS
jgi:sugar lactone lactonase YvrE